MYLNTPLTFIVWSFLLCRTALCPGPYGIQVGTPPASHNSVLPGGLCYLCGLHACVWLQTSLEWRCRGSSAGGAGGRPHGEWTSQKPKYQDFMYMFGFEVFLSDLKCRRTHNLRFENEETILSFYLFSISGRIVASQVSVEYKQTQTSWVLHD